jgi:hypothetical protein
MAAALGWCCFMSIFNEKETRRRGKTGARRLFVRWGDRLVYRDPTQNKEVVGALH